MSAQGFVVRILVIAVLCAAALSAQTTTGSIQGAVRDNSGASVPNATVIVENEKTGIKQQLTTRADGRYVMPLLLPGDYSVTVEASGFQRYSHTGVRLDVQQALVVDAELVVGSLNTEVRVTGAAAPLNTTSSTVSTVIENKRILDLPLNSRDPYALATLAPGVFGGLTTVSGGVATPWISGGRDGSSEVSIDGTSVIVPEMNVSVNISAFQPSVDAVEEFTVLTNSLAAEYGRTGGGVINVATRQGTNQIHGSAFEFLRNSRLDANGFFRNRSGVPRGAFQRNQFGGTLGGPVVIPNTYNGHSRTFFFVDYQGTRTGAAASLTDTMPLDAWKRGDFSNLRNASGQLIQVFDPLTTQPDGRGNFVRDPFPGNTIPVARLDPIARNLMQYYPNPNTAPVNQFTQVNNFFSTGKEIIGDDRYDIRLDHNVNAQWRMFGRFSRDYFTDNPVNYYGNPATAGNGAATTDGRGSSVSHNTSASLDHTITFSPTTVMSLRYGFGRVVNDIIPFSKGFDPAQLGFPKSYSAQAAQFGLNFPRFDINGVAPLGQRGFNNMHFAPSSHVAHADITKVLSRHTIKGGVEFRRQLVNLLFSGTPDGQFAFDQRWTQQDPVRASATQGFGLASLLLGVPTSGTMTHDPTPAMASSYWGLYLQDDFRVNSKLTLNIGLRYELDLPRTERYNRLSYFDIGAPSPIAGKVAGFPNLTGAMKFVSPENRAQVPTDTNNIGPRFGFAYSVQPKTVVRGAYGLMYAGSVMQAAGHVGSAGMEGFRSSTPFVTSLDSRTPIHFLRDPFPDGFNLPLGSAAGALSGPSTNLGLTVQESFFLDSRNPVIQQWNFNLQRQLPGNVVIEAGYLGSKGNHLVDGEGSIAYNQLPASNFALGNSLNDLVPNPFFGVVLNPSSVLSKETVQRSQLLRPYPQYASLGGFRKPQANSLYHAFTLRVEKRYSNGMSILVSYTGGKLIDDASQLVNFLGPIGNKQNFYNRRAERSVSTQDVSSRLVTSFVYDLPVGKGRRLLGTSSRALDHVIGGWQVNGIVTFQTGTPVILTQAQNNTGLGSPGQRPNNNGKSAHIDGGSTNDRLQRWFQPDVFSLAPAFTFGNVGRTLPDVRNPGQRNFDLSVYKNFPFRENRLNLQLRGEAFNALNRVQFSAPGSVVGNPTIGVISGTSVDARQMQVALRLRF